MATAGAIIVAGLAILAIAVLTAVALCGTGQEDESEASLADRWRALGVAVMFLVLVALIAAQILPQQSPSPAGPAGQSQKDIIHGTQ